MALVTLYGRFGIQGRAQLALSLLTGFVLGVIVMIADLGVPVDFAGWVALVLYGLIPGLVAIRGVRDRQGHCNTGCVRLSMVQATLIAACIACLVAGIISLLCARKPCDIAKRNYRIVTSLVWFSLAALYSVAYLMPGIYLVKSGILTRLLVVTMAVIYSGELLLERKL